MDKEWFYTFFEQDYFRKTPEQIGPAIDGSVAQAEFLVDVLHLSPNHRILDLCCGYGRHSIGLARMGYKVTGFDLCERALKLAGQKAQEENLGVHLVRGDIRTLPFGSEFDCIYHLFAFGYFEDDDDVLKVLCEASRVLKPKGKLLVDVINGPRILRDFMERDQAEEAERHILHERSYDAGTRRLRSEWTFVYKGTGETNKHLITERLCSVDELVSMIDSVGLRALNIYGDFDRTEHSEDSKRIIVVAGKQ
ncbi:class I SAM-dependent methyltransferase [Candidatus Poribacteria bacterium]